MLFVDFYMMKNVVFDFDHEKGTVAKMEQFNIRVNIRLKILHQTVFNRLLSGA